MIPGRIPNGTRAASGGKRRFFIRAAALLLAACAAACAARAEDVERQIRQRDASWSAVAQTRDVDKVLAYWSDDATVLPPGGPAITGKAALRAFITKSYAEPGFSISWTTGKVVVAKSGDLAYVTGTNHIKFTGPDGKPASADGKALTIWRREGDGVWRCVLDIWNDAGPPAP